MKGDRKHTPDDLSTAQLSSIIIPASHSVSSTKWSGINEWNKPLRCFSAACVIGVFQYWFLWGLYGNSSMQMILLTWCKCLYRLHRRVQMARIVPTVLCLPFMLPGNWLWHSDFMGLMFGDNHHCLLICQISVLRTCCIADRILQQRGSAVSLHQQTW